MEWRKYNPPSDAVAVLSTCPQVTIAGTVVDLVDLACGGPQSDNFEVAFETPGFGKVVEATAARVRNGVAANYVEPYMRRRDPDCMVIADDLLTNKPRFKDRFGYDFRELRAATFAWLKTQPLALFGFTAGQHGMGQDALVIAPANTGFFALGLALLQGITAYEDIPPDFRPSAIIYVAPPFRHTHFDGKQVVIHNRRDGLHEMFSYNLYPGPSAKRASMVCSSARVSVKDG